ncbi:MAG: hypothetical protein ACK5MJ_02190 [Alphaproteobacteria bacterium]
MREIIRQILRFIAFFIVPLRYRVNIIGKDKIDAPNENDTRPILFLSTHPCFADPVLTMQSLWPKYRPKPLASSTQTERIGIGSLLKLWDPVEIPNIWVQGRDRVQQTRDAIESIGQALADGSNVLLYPAGRFPRNGYEDLGARSSVTSILSHRPDARIVLIRHVGLWGSRTGRQPWNDVPPLHIVAMQAIVALIANLIVFMPKRNVKIVMEEVTDFPVDGSRLEVNNYLESYFNAEYQPLVKTPLFFWQKVQVLPNIEPPKPIGWDKLKKPE